MFCETCGAFSEQGSEYCASCGARLNISPNQQQNHVLPNASSIPAFDSSQSDSGNVPSGVEPAIKPGAERIWGLILMIVAIPVAYAWMGFSYTFDILGVLLGSLPGVLSLLAGVFGLQFVRRYGKTDSAASQLSSLARSDCVAGITLILNIILFHIFGLVCENFGLVPPTDDFMTYTLVAIPAALPLIVAIVFYLRGSRIAKNTKVATTGTFLVATIVLGVYILSYVFELLPMTGLLSNALMIAHAVLLAVFLILRGFFWYRVAARISPKLAVLKAASGIETNATLTGGAKFGYFALGFFLGFIGILIAWLTNRDRPTSKDAVKFSIIGFVVSTSIGLLLAIVLIILFLVMS